MYGEIDTIIGLFERSCSKFPNHVYLWECHDNKYIPTSYQATHSEVLAVAAGLMAGGLQKGDRVALLSEGCNAWVYSELGILYAGGTDIPLSIRLTENELLFRIRHSEARFLIVSDYYVNTIRKIEKDLPGIEKIFVIHFSGAETEKYRSFEHLKEDGRSWVEKKRSFSGRTYKTGFSGRSGQYFIYLRDHSRSERDYAYPPELCSKRPAS